jgi:septum formation protein
VRLILASASPRRQSLLKEAGYDFLVHVSAVDEDEFLGRMLPANLAVFLAKAKASDVAPNFPEDVTLAADTVVAFGDMSLGKPADESEARDMLELLSGTTHIVITGVAVRCPDKNIDLSQKVLSAVRMRRLSNREIDDYVATGLWRGKAGGYGIQDHDPVVTCITGSHTNVVGLPLAETRELLARAGIHART